MDSCIGGTDTASPFSEEGTSSAVIDPVLLSWVSQRSLLPCHHNDSPLNGLVYLGHVDLGICGSSPAVHHLIGTEKQVFLEVPLPQDRFCVYSRCKNPIKPRRKHGLYDLQLLVCFSPSPKAKKLLQYSASAFTSCGFEMRWSTGENNELLMHIYLKLLFILDSDITCEVEKIRKLVRNGFNRCANTVLSLLYPELAESLNECSGRWFEKLYTKSRENFDTFFAMVRACRLNPPVYNLKLDGLKSRLHPFQRDAVNFLVHRELSFNVDHGELMRVINLPEQQNVRYFPYFGLFTRSRGELCHGEFSTGGILADEMGLGKTVEILALIMSHTPETVPVLASMNENEEQSLDVNMRSREIEADVTATVEFLKCSIAAACEVEYMFPPRKRLPDSKTLVRTGDYVTCEACGVQYRIIEVYWSQALDSRMKRFTCPYCIEGADISFDVSTTLIVVPESLLHQWYEEIRRHCTEDVRIDVYYGVAYDGYKHPLYLESYDIVLCAYETLQKEIHHVITTSPKELRKRAHPTAREYPSPLLALNFWRVCLDECQLVRNKVKAASKLCSMLKARHRWCVTGTPLSSSVNDLYGLFHFLGFFPYSIDAVWEHYIFYPYLKSTPAMMMSLISKLFWRNSKKDAWNQLENIVRQENLVVLSFTPIEERLYASKIESSKTKMYSLVCSLLRHNHINTPLSSLPSAKIDQIFSIINDVRLSIVAGESYKQLKDTNYLPDFRIFSQELIFRKLLEDATTLACQRYRDMIANRNALAGIHILMGDDLRALSWYKQAYNVHSEQAELNRLLGLQDEDVQMSAHLIEQVKGNNRDDVPKLQKESSFSDPSRPCKSLRIDSLQVIHIGRNVESLAKTSENAKEFVESSGIADLARRSHQRYVRAEVVGVSRVKKRWCEADSLWLEANEEFDVARTSYVIMLDGFSGKISFDKFKASFPIPSCNERLGSSVTSSDYLRLFDEDIYALREFYTNFRLAVLSMLLPFMPKQEDSNSQMTEEVLPLPLLELPEFTHMLTCRHNTPVNYGASVNSTHDASENSHSSHFFPLPLVDSCPLCEVNGFLFKHDASNQIDPVLCRGKASAEYFVKQLWLSRRDLRSRAWSIYQKLINWFNVIEKLVSVARELTVVIQEWVNREREIVVGATRLQLGMAVQFFSSAAPLILDSSNLDIAMALCCQSEKSSAEAVSKSLSSLRYLNTLRRHSESHPDEVRECPCCYSEMKHVWVVFPCAHTVCRTCMEKLKSKSPNSRSMSCITCRQPCSVDSTMYVVDNEHEPLSRIKITVKFEKIIRLLKNLIAEDCTNKIIVFTSISAAIPPFEELLKLLKLPALVLSRGLKSDMLNKFRNNPKLKILLLPLRMGANGLNLTQANHVVFMEPITEMSVFAQAVGRIDRIGQRRAITVHNFVVRGSIEKEIYRIVSKGTEQSRWTLHTLCQVFGFDMR